MAKSDKSWFETISRFILQWIYIGISGLYAPLVYAFWTIVSLPLKYANNELFYKIQGFLDEMFCAVCAGSSLIGDCEFFETGDDITPCLSGNARTLFLSNHVNPEDIFLALDLLNSRPMLPKNIMWASFEPMKYVPVGIILQMRNDFFLKQGKEFREENLQYVQNHLREVFIPRRRFIIMYPEGGFPHHLRKINDRFAKKNNLPELKHTLLPRVGAMKTIIDVLAPKDGKRYLDYVVDITLGHEIENPYIVACMTMRRKNRFGFLYRVYKVDDIPREEEAMKQWLYDRWVEKDNFLKEFHETGNFPDYGSLKPTVVKQDLLKIIFGNIFCLVSFIFQAALVYFLYVNLF